MRGGEERKEEKGRDGWELHFREIYDEMIDRWMFKRDDKLSIESVGASC